MPPAPAALRELAGPWGHSPPPPQALHIFSSCHLLCSAVIARTLPSVCIFQRAGTNLTYRAAVTRGSALPPCISAAGPWNAAIRAASPQQCPWHSTGRDSMAQHTSPHHNRASGELRFRIPAISHHLETTQSNNDNTPPQMLCWVHLRTRPVRAPPHFALSPRLQQPGSPAPCSWGGHAAGPGVCQLIRDDI